MVKIKEDILDIIKRGFINENGDEYTLPKIHLERSLYLEVNKVLEGMGFKWNKKTQSHISKESLVEEFDNMLLTGEWVNNIKKFQFFPTPAPVVEIMSKNIDFSKIRKILEPSAGEGSIAFNYEKLCEGKEIHLVELDPKKNEVLKKKIKNNMKNDYFIHSGDFLEFDSEKDFDLIIANPPFSKNQNIAHFYKMYSLMRCGNSTLRCIMPASAEYKNSNKFCKDFLEFVKNIDGRFYKLPENSFKESGTTIDTIYLEVKR